MGFWHGRGRHVLKIYNEKINEKFENILGVVGALSFAILTDKGLLALSPKNSLLLMLIVPFTLAFVYWRY